MGRLHLRLALVFLLSTSLLGRVTAQSTWTGLGADANWSTAGNWTTAPISSNTLQVLFGASLFPASTIDGDFDLNELTFTNAAGAYTLSGPGILRLNGASSTLTHNGASTATIDSNVVFAGNGTIAGTGTANLIISNLWSQDGILSVNRNLTVNTLRLGIDGGANSAKILTGTNTLTLTGDIRFEVLPSTNVAAQSAPIAELGGNVLLTSGTHQFIGKNYSSVTGPGQTDFNISAVLSGPGGFTKVGDSVELVPWLVFNAQNTYTGPTVLESFSEATFIGVANALPSGTALTIKNGAAFLLTDSETGSNGFNQTVGSLSDGGTTGGAVFLGPTNTAIAPVLTLGGNNSTTTYAGQFTNGGSIVKVGTGTFTVTALDSNFLGGVTVNGGRFNTNGQTGVQSGTGSGSVTVNNNGTFGGTGRANGALTINSGGRLAPGTADTTPGTLTIGGNITLNSGAVFLVRLNGTTPGSFTQLVAQSGVTLSGSTLSASTGFTPAVADKFYIINITSNAFVTGEFAGLPQASSFDINGNTAFISYFGDIANNTVMGGNDVVISFSPIPEPTTILGLAVGALLVGRRLRRVF